MFVGRAVTGGRRTLIHRQFIQCAHVTYSSKTLRRKPCIASLTKRICRYMQHALPRHPVFHRSCRGPQHQGLPSIRGGREHQVSQLKEAAEKSLSANAVRGMKYRKVPRSLNSIRYVGENFQGSESNWARSASSGSSPEASCVG